MITPTIEKILSVMNSKNDRAYNTTADWSLNLKVSCNATEHCINKKRFYNT